jgi:hypothetical protein
LNEMSSVSRSDGGMYGLVPFPCCLCNIRSIPIPQHAWSAAICLTVSRMTLK